MSAQLVTVIFFVLIFADSDNFAGAIKLCLVLLVASIPIAMQVVCTATMAVGSRALAAKDAVVARLSAIEVRARRASSGPASRCASDALTARVSTPF